MEVIKKCYGNNSFLKMLGRNTSRWLALATTATTCGFFYTTNQAKRNVRDFFSFPVVHASKHPEDDSWFSKMMTKKDSDIKPSLSPEYITSLLKEQEYSYKTDLGVVSWFETNHYKANDPIEDRHCECYINRNNAFFFGIFDGHSGWHCSETLRLRLPQYISLAMGDDKCRQEFLSQKFDEDDLVEYLSNPKDDCPSFKMPDSFIGKQEALKSGVKYFAGRAKDMVPKLSRGDVLQYTYVSMDQDICRESIPNGNCNESIWTGLSGAVAVGVYIEGADMYIGNTGDCRAVLGTKSNSGKWLSIPMTEDHTCNSREEVDRLNKEHPGEEQTVVSNGRLLGQLQPSRSFGDVVYKWSIELHRKVIDLLYGQAVIPVNVYRTPPYLIAKPEVSHKKLSHDDRFIILATDGLWDTVTSEKAVQIVGEYLDEREKRDRNSAENAATRLIRFALGNGSDYQLAEMIQIPLQNKRDFHDDITVTVVFFDNTTLHSSKL